MIHTYNSLLEFFTSSYQQRNLTFCSQVHIWVNHCLSINVFVAVKLSVWYKNQSFR